MGKTDTLRFRHNQAIWAAAIIAFLGAVPLAASGWVFVPLLLIPIAVGVWAWRAGTDSDAAGLRVRAMLGERRIPWSEIAELAPDPQRRVVARLRDGRTIPLTAVKYADLPHLIAKSGRRLGDGQTSGG